MNAPFRVRVSIVGAAIFGCVHSAHAQQPTGVTVPARPTKLAIAKLTVPELSRFTLPNGLRVLMASDPRAPLFEARLVIGSGWRAETSGEPGTSLLVRESVMGGTSGVSANRLDSLGVLFAAATAGTDAEGLTTSFRMSGPSPSLESALALLSAVVRQPDMSPAEINRQRQRFIESRRRRLDNPFTLVSEHALALLRTPSFRSNAAPSDSALSLRTPEEIGRFHSANYVPQNAILVIIAPQSVDEVRRITSLHLGRWESRPGVRRAESRVNLPATSKVETLLRPGSTQGTIAVGTQLGGQESPDYAATLLLRLLILRRLNEELRVARGWTYGVDAGGVQAAFATTFVIRASVKPGRTGDALSIIKSELARLAAKPPDSAEVNLAMRIVSAALARPSESREVAAERIATAETLGLRRDYWPALQRAFAGLHGTNLQSAARRYFTPGAMSVVVLGDSSVLRSVAPVISR
ncbi:MAG: insulinase family protein [Gemmatimonadota bacterium]|nr:insulinase family protein [Gemmatimonadota bacterium]